MNKVLKEILDRWDKYRNEATYSGISIGEYHIFPRMVHGNLVYIISRGEGSVEKAIRNRIIEINDKKYLEKFLLVTFEKFIITEAYPKEFFKVFRDPFVRAKVSNISDDRILGYISNYYKISLKDLMDLENFLSNVSWESINKFFSFFSANFSKVGDVLKDFKKYDGKVQSIISSLIGRGIREVSELFLAYKVLGGNEDWYGEAMKVYFKVGSLFLFKDVNIEELKKANYLLYLSYLVLALFDNFLDYLIPKPITDFLVKR